MSNKKTFFIIIGITASVFSATVIIFRLPGGIADASSLDSPSSSSVSADISVPGVQTVNSFLYGYGYAPSPDQANAPQPAASTASAAPTGTAASVIAATTTTAETASTTIATTTNAAASPSGTPSTPETAMATTTVTVATSTTNTATASSMAADASTSTIFTLPYSVGTFGNHFTPGDGWMTWWGTAADASGTLELIANGTSTGAGALLSGSEQWRNYTFAANVDWLKGQTFGLVGRYVDGGDYVLCDFSATPGGVLMTLRQYANGTSTDLATGDVYNSQGIGEMGVDVALQVQDNLGACAFDGHEISSLIAGTSLSGTSSTTGGVGFTEWDPAEGNAEIAVHTIGIVKDSYRLGSYDDQTTLY